MVPRFIAPALPSPADCPPIELAIGHARADLVARYNKDEAWEGRRDAFARVSAHIARA